MLKTFFVLLIISLTFSSFGCGRKPENNAEAFIESYYEHIRNAKFTDAANCYHTSFAKNMPKARLIQKLKNMHQQLGKLNQVRLASWTSHTQKGSGLEGNYYIFNYENGYANEKQVQETFIILEPQSGNNQIMSHNMNATLLSTDPLAPDEQNF